MYQDQVGDQISKDKPKNSCEYKSIWEPITQSTYATQMSTGPN